MTFFGNFDIFHSFLVFSSEMRKNMKKIFDELVLEKWCSYQPLSVILILIQNQNTIFIIVACIWIDWVHLNKRKLISGGKILHNMLSNNHWNHAYLWNNTEMHAGISSFNGKYNYVCISGASWHISARYGGKILICGCIWWLGMGLLGGIS